MKKSRFTAEQIVSILNEVAKKDTKLAEICRKHGITEQTYYRRRRAYGGLQVKDTVRTAINRSPDRLDAVVMAIAHTMAPVSVPAVKPYAVALHSPYSEGGVWVDYLGI